MAHEAGITTLNEAREQLGLAAMRGDEGKQRYVKPNSRGSSGGLPRNNENKPPEEAE